VSDDQRCLLTKPPRSEAAFELAVIGLDRVGVLLNVMPRGRNQLVEYLR
jgi:hypothetical protein